MKTNFFKGIIVIAILCLFMIFPYGTVSAETSGSNDLVILQKALLNKIEYTPEWLDTNGDSDFDLTDLIRLKKHLAGEDISFNPLKYSVVTFKVDGTKTVQRYYKNECRLPALPSPFKFWKIDKKYYSENNIYPLNPYGELTFTATESNKEVNLPILPF